LLKRSSLLFFLAFFAGSIAYAQDTYLFIGSYNGDKDKTGIYIYRMNMQSGQLDSVCAFSGILNPSYLVLSADGKYIYACSETRTAGMGSVSSYAFDRKGRRITMLSRQDSGGENPVYLAVDKSGKWLINGNYTVAGVAVHPLQQDGAIGATKQLFPFIDSSITDRQTGAHIHSTVFSPTLEYLFSPDLGADKIRRFRFDADLSNPLQPDSFIRTVPGGGPRHFTFHPNGKFAYCVEEMAGAVTAFSYQRGQLDSIQRVMTHDTTPYRFYNSADIHISPDGRFLYASNRGEENNIAIFSIASNGKLTLKGFQSTLGEHPRNFLIDPTGRYLIAANQLEGNVVVFKRNMQSGMLSATGIEVKMPGPSSLQIKTYNN